MARTPEELDLSLSLSLSLASLRAQEQNENQLREKATTVLSAASILVPAAAIAIGSGPVVAAIPFGGAAVAYVLCVRACGAALFPQGLYAGLLGSELLQAAKAGDADIGQMQASAAVYLDQGYRHNQAIVEAAAERVGRAIVLLTVELLALVLALVVNLAS
jgi:hypothetical protein